MTTLSIKEQGRLIELELLVCQGIRSTLRTAEALHAIREEKLYRTQGTFEEYCLKKFALKSSQVYRLIEFWQVRQEISPVGEIGPETERQTRPLNGLPPGDRKAAWDRAVSDAGGQQPTGKQVEEAAEIEFYTKKHLATLPADVQLEYLQASEKVILDRAAKREAVEETEAHIKRAERLVFHSRRCVAMAKTMGKDGEDVLETFQVGVAKAVLLLESLQQAEQLA